jgi:tryptophan halogenase
MNIVIVGGGTAGWLAALMIKKIQKNHTITVVESSKIPIVGAGEGSTGYLTDIIQNRLWNFDCNEKDFLLETGSTIKLGIKHKDWYKVGHTYYGPIDASVSASGTNDPLLAYALTKNIPLHTTSRNGYLIEKNSSSFYLKNSLEVEDVDTAGHAYHFDAHKVGQYFKKVVVKDGVNVLDVEVLDVILNQNGIEKLILSNSTELTADLYIDCTGFARKLISKLGVKWKSYKENLPVNSAMPFIMPFEKDETIEPVTTAHALSSGWMWKIPVDLRYGCGYVFDSNFITPDQAHQELETILGKKVEPIRVLNFDTGRNEELWHKNCLSLGLAAAFAEPLEATSIHSTIVQLTTFIFDYLRDEVDSITNIGSQKIYNQRMCRMYDDFKDFLVVHYQSTRTDSEFWRWLKTGETQTEKVSGILELVKSKIPTNSDFTAFYGYAGASLWNWVLAGLGHITPEVAKKELKFFNTDEKFIKEQYDWFTTGINEQLKSMIENTEFVKNKGKYL